VSERFDVVVLGAGPGGYVAAIRAAQLGRRVAIIEPRYWGGVCLNVGCIPSKALLRNAELAHLLRNEADTFGISSESEIKFDYGVAYSRSRKVADARARGVRFLMKKNDITEIEGYGTFTDPHTIQVALNARGTQTVEFDNCIVATGASARLLPGTAIGPRVVTYTEQILSDTLPSSVIIVGAGAVGIEFAYVLRAYSVNVTILEFFDRPLPLEDEEVSAELARRYRRLGIEVLTGAAVQTIEESGDSVSVTFTRGGQTETRQADKVLQAIGFAPNVTGYGLENTGVQLGPRREIAVDRRGRTNVPHIFAIGDVTAELMLAHAAESMGIVAAETIAGAETMEIDFVMVPRATFCQPQVASFGWTEAQAREKGFAVKVAKFPFSANGKARGIADPVGFVKLLADEATGELLGAHMIGPDVTELLPELTLAQQWELGAQEVARNIHSHPTLSEAVKEAVHGLAGHMINF
jgi:dihydrolipoamide dehydrogenase